MVTTPANSIVQRIHVRRNGASSPANRIPVEITHRQPLQPAEYLVRMSYIVF